MKEQRYDAIIATYSLHHLTDKDKVNFIKELIKLLNEKSIKNFIKILSDINDGIKINIIGKIVPLHHQDYDGKRVNLKITDNFDKYYTYKIRYRNT